MPLITPEQASAPERRTPSRRGLLLLLVPPTLLLLMFQTAAVRPLQLGSAVVTTRHSSSPGCGWQVYLGPVTGLKTRYIAGAAYAVTGPGQDFTLSLGERQCCVIWFYGHRAS